MLVQDTDVPVFLRDRHYGDLREDYSSGFEALKKALAAKPEPSEQSLARRARRTVDLLAVLMSLLAAAASVVSMLGTTVIKAEPYTLGVVIMLVVGLTGLVALISVYRPGRRSQPLEAVTRSVERTYIDALDESKLNPLRAREVARG